MIVSAQFIGAHGSLGYETGKRYLIRVSGRGGIAISRVTGGGRCPYQSLDAFLRNWTGVRAVVDERAKNKRPPSFQKVAEFSPLSQPGAVVVAPPADPDSLSQEEKNFERALDLAAWTESVRLRSLFHAVTGLPPDDAIIRQRVHIENGSRERCYYLLPAMGSPSRSVSLLLRVTFPPPNNIQLYAVGRSFTASTFHSPHFTSPNAHSTPSSSDG